MLQATALRRTPDEIRAEVARATAAGRQAIENAARCRARGNVSRARLYTSQAARIEAHLAAYAWLLGDVDIAPVTHRRVPAVTARDLFLEQAPGRDHAERNTHRYDDPERLFPEAVFDAIAWARREFDDPPSGG